MLTRLMSGINFIYDRTTLIDDFVYSFLNESESTLSKYFDIIKALLAQCKIVHLIIDEPTRQQRLEQRGDKYITNDMISKIREQYSNFYDKLDKPCFVYQLTNNIDLDVKTVMEEINDKDNADSSK